MTSVTTSVEKTTLDTKAEPSAEEKVASIVVAPVPVRERQTFDLVALVEMAAPALFAIVAVVFAVLSIQRIETLVSWGDIYAGSGAVTVVDCEPQDQRGPDQWLCLARITTQDGVSRAKPTTLVASKGALVSDRPYVGQELDVYFQIPDAVVLDGWSPDRSYPQASQLTELTRLYFSLIPRLLILLGSLAWLLGWFTTRGSHRLTRGGWWERIPFRFTLQRRGVGWTTLGLVIFLIAVILEYQIFGSVGAA